MPNITPAFEHGSDSRITRFSAGEWGALRKRKGTQGRTDFSVSVCCILSWPLLRELRCPLSLPLPFVPLLPFSILFRHRMSTLSVADETALQEIGRDLIQGIVALCVESVLWGECFFTLSSARSRADGSVQRYTSSSSYSRAGYCCESHTHPRRRSAAPVF